MPCEDGSSSKPARKQVQQQKKNMYSFGLHLARFVVDALSNKLLHISIRTLKSPMVDFKQESKWWGSYHSLVEKLLKGHKIRLSIYLYLAVPSVAL